MSRLFVSIYLDEDVSALVATLLASRGYVVTTTLAQGNIGRSDPEQLAFATSRQMALLSHNRADFETLCRHYVDAGLTHSGVILAVRRQPHDIVKRLLRLLDEVTADEMDNQLRYI